MMKFLGIRALKSELLEGSLRQSDVFGYWLAMMLLINLTLLPLAEQPSAWDYSYWFVSLVVSVVMLRKCYLANGGASGVKFSDRYVSISWVMTVRGILFVFIPLQIIVSVIVSLVGVNSGFSQQSVQALLEKCSLFESIICELWIWSRTVAHIRDVR